MQLCNCLRLLVSASASIAIAKQAQLLIVTNFDSESPIPSADQRTNRPTN